jgi:hypothetical protein
MALENHENAHSALTAAGFLAVGGAGALALRGTWPAAALCAFVAAVLLWLVGTWTWPRGADAYVRRISNVLLAWRRETEHPGGYLGSTSRAVKQLEAARPPQRAAAAHTDLIAAFVANEEAERAALAAELHGDGPAAVAAQARADDAYTALRAAYDAVVTALGDDLRWPPRE